MILCFLYSSAIDFTKANFLDEYPLHLQAKYSETILCPGDVLYIPRWCWHLVISIDSLTARKWIRTIHRKEMTAGQDDMSHCISVSFWWGKRIEKPAE